MDMPQEFLEMVKSDIDRIDNIANASIGELLKLHRELDGKYQACIKEWRAGMWGSNVESTQIYYTSIQDSRESLYENLQMMKAKLQTFRFRMNSISTSETQSPQINVTTNVNITITFDEVRRKIEDMTALSQKETDEAIEKVNDLEAISKENISRKSKWEKVKPIIAYAMDKGADLGIAILTLIVQMKLGM